MPPKPPSRPDRISLWARARLFRENVLAAQPERLYGAWMAEFRTPFFRSFLINQPELLTLVLKARPEDFPKADRLSEGLAPLLGQSVFQTNGALWARQRRIIDPAFAGGRLKDTVPAMQAAARASVARLAAQQGPVDIEAETSHFAADVIFRTLFSLPIEDGTAQRTFQLFRAYQRAQPILTAGALIPRPRWLRRRPPAEARHLAAEIRALIRQLTETRMAEIRAGTAPDDLATKIMTTVDPQTGQGFGIEEMVDQVAIFFLAGHETSASALSWALYLLAVHPDWQARAAAEARAGVPGLAGLGHRRLIRDIFRETLRLYPPLPMVLREARCPVHLRGRRVPRGAQVVISPWHLHRHRLLWDNPDGFDPARWQSANGQRGLRDAFLPFLAGPRVCLGAGFAMIEGQLFLCEVLSALELAPVPGRVPVPVSHLTLRSGQGIWLQLRPRGLDDDVAAPGDCHPPGSSVN
ncbi:cytochrome P450 [Pseudooceanicola sp. CBS1P-1]|uniref:Cytochrome P450 n=1 Tax=Pseudooceanicola albus TaxID=2692189 RepID=A0A6L7G4D0_9RHOB|nr:cytochrome P450 [Pseudooceanicola endophyticus]MXN17503.1 cytochrome P450 [Pseudooceanicola albus]